MRSEQQLLDFMNKRPHMVISTLNDDGKPQSAVVGFGANNKLQLIFGTSKNSRKAQNIIKNPFISAVIGWDDEGTIQLEGTARPLEKDEIAEFTEVYFIKSPGARAYRDDPDEQYFVVSPTWLRYTDVSAYPWDITELKF